MTYREFILESFTNRVIKDVSKKDAIDKTRKDVILKSLGFNGENMTPKEAIDFSIKYCESKHLDVVTELKNSTVIDTIEPDNIIIRKVPFHEKYEIIREVPFDMATSLLEGISKKDTRYKGIICLTFSGELNIFEIDAKDQFLQIYKVDDIIIICDDFLGYDELPELLDIFIDPLKYKK